MPLPQQLVADVPLPASKSVSNRALLLRALCPEERYPIANLAACDDTDHMQQGIAAKRAGAPVIDIGATGTAMRFLTAWLAITEGETVITGSERMQQRPIGTLVDALRTLGADISYINKEGYPPLRIKGQQLEGGELEIEASISSQYISALLMIAPRLTRGFTLHLKGTVASRTYIDLTLDLMRRYGATAEWTDERTIHVHPGRYEDTPLTVEGDWSAASYWYELAAVAAMKGHEVDILLRRLNPDSRQGDRMVAAMFETLGVKTEYTAEGARLTRKEFRSSGVTGSSDNTDVTSTTPSAKPSSVGTFVCTPALLTPELPHKTLDFTHCPDIAQTLAVTCCLMGVPYTFSGIRSLRIKETDRVAALIAELRKLGYVLRADGDDCLVWDGTRCPPDDRPAIATYDDHRMAMAFAPAALCHEGLTIEHPEVVSKSYPTFWQHLSRVESGKMKVRANERNASLLAISLREQPNF